jgi:hypothetical protein
MELKRIITEYLDINRREQGGFLPESIANGYKFRLADLDDLLTLDCQLTS